MRCLCTGGRCTLKNPRQLKTFSWRQSLQIRLTLELKSGLVVRVYRSWLCLALKTSQVNRTKERSLMDLQNTKAQDGSSHLTRQRLRVSEYGSWAQQKVEWTLEFENLTYRTRNVSHNSVQLSGATVQSDEAPGKKAHRFTQKICKLANNCTF